MYNAIVAILKFIVVLFSGLEIHGSDNIPSQGGVVIAANHVSILDPIALASGVDRPIHFMAKNELFRNRFLNWLFRKVHAFPVKRGTADREAIRRAISILESGNIVGIFPEGTRSKEAQELHNGAALIGIKASVPIVPVVIHNIDFLKFRRKVSVHIGEPIFPKEGKRATKAELDLVSNQIAKQFTFLSRKEST